MRARPYRVPSRIEGRPPTRPRPGWHWLLLVVGSLVLSLMLFFVISNVTLKKDSNGQATNALVTPGQATPIRQLTSTSQQASPQPATQQPISTKTPTPEYVITTDAVTQTIPLGDDVFEVPPPTLYIDRPYLFAVGVIKYKGRHLQGQATYCSHPYRCLRSCTQDGTGERHARPSKAQQRCALPYRHCRPP